MWLWDFTVIIFFDIFACPRRVELRHLLPLSGLKFLLRINKPVTRKELTILPFIKLYPLNIKLKMYVYT